MKSSIKTVKNQLIQELKDRLINISNKRYQVIEDTALEGPIRPYHTLLHARVEALEREITELLDAIETYLNASEQQIKLFNYALQSDRLSTPARAVTR